MTQGDPVSLTIFNIVVGAVVRAFLMEVCGLQEANHGFGWSVVNNNILFYVNDGQIAGRNPIWVQSTVSATLRIFKRLGLQTNLGKAKAMVCTLGFIRDQQGAVVYKRRAKGEGSTFW